MRLPAPFSLPRFPPRINLPRVEVEISEEEEMEPSIGGEELEDFPSGATTKAKEEFLRRMREEGFDEELITMGLKVAANHLREPEDAYRIGANYVREMAK